MRVIITGKGMDVSDYLKEMVTKKVSKLERYFKPSTEAHVTMSIQKARHIVEVTILFHGVVLRGEEASGDMYSSMDGVLRKLEKQIHKHRTALKRRLHESAFDQNAYEYHDEMEEEAMPEIVRTKRFVVKPMDVKEAQMQLELLGHQFFVFRNAASDEVNVLYKRDDGDLGLIEPDYA
jgi:putative sigma-54 modulation protein